jgi:molecular chaperone DnaK
MPQIEVAFDIDANGILNVTAKDKATGKEQKIVIKASSGLSDEEIEKMIADAEAHAEEDKKFKELADTKNQGDALVHATEKTLSDLGEKVDQEERAKIETATAELKEALKGDNKDTIDTKVKALSEVSAPLAQRLYEEKAQEAANESNDSDKKEDKDVVDGEFEEVDDSKSADKDA